MLARKASIISACLILGSAIGQAQSSSEQAPSGEQTPPPIHQRPLITASDGLPIEPVRIESPSDRIWTPPEAVHVLDPLQEGGNPEVHIPLGSCGCGDAKCPGVCRDPGHPQKPFFTKPGDRNRGDCPPYRYHLSDQERAGNPHGVAPWAICSVNEKYSAWFVGGGAACWRGRCRQPSEGTWGLDYSGLFGHANVWLTYTRGRKQGGEGAYATDGEPEFVKLTHEFLGHGH